MQFDFWTEPGYNKQTGASKGQKKKEGEQTKTLLLRRVAGTVLGILLIGGVIYSTSFLKLSKD